MATDCLVLKHQIISNHSAAYAPMGFQLLFFLSGGGGGGGGLIVMLLGWKENKQKCFVVDKP